MYGKSKSKKHLVNQLMARTINIILENLGPAGRTKHFQYTMELLFTVKIFKECNSSLKLSVSDKTTAQKRNKKLIILQHL